MALSNERFPVRLFPTALATDVLFYELVDGRIPKNARPVYDTPHPDTVHWPHHRLCYVEPAPSDSRNLSGTDGFQRWYYVATRENQDLYNFEFTAADVDERGGNKFDAVRRTYVNRRDAFLPEGPKNGDTMPNVPADLFGVGNGDPSPSPEFVLAYRKTRRIEQQELDSLFIVDEHIYIRRCSITSVVTNDLLGLGGRRVETLYFRGENVLGFAPATKIEDLVADDASSYWGLQAGGNQRDVQQLSEDWFLVTYINNLTDALDNFVISNPARVNVDLPPTLKSIEVVWNESEEVGTNDNQFSNVASGESFVLNGENSDEGNSSASLLPEVNINLESFSSNTVNGTAYAFYLPSPVTTADILTRLAALVGGPVSVWPIFKLASSTITTIGQSARVRVRTSASSRLVREEGEITGEGRQSSTGDSVEVTLNNGTTQIPPCLHGEIPVTGLTTRSKTVSATATSGIISSYAPPILPFKTRAVTVTGRVYPTSIPATDPPGLPDNGWYLADSRVAIYDHGYVTVYVEVFHAGQLA